MLHTKFLLLFFLLAGIQAGCKKNNTPQDELSKLPAATQTGANTFGCLVNGKAFIAQTDCKFLCDPAFKVNYDGANGGSISLIAVYQNSASGIDQGIVIGFDSTNYKMQFLYSPTTALNIGFTFINNNLFTRSWDAMVITTGKIVLTRYDLTNGIISGTFEFSLSKSGTETMIFTNGRFDKKL